MSEEYIASITVTADKKEVITAPSHVALIQEITRVEGEITKVIRSIWRLGISPIVAILPGVCITYLLYASKAYAPTFITLCMTTFVLLVCEWIVYRQLQTNFSLQIHRLPVLYLRRNKWRYEYARQYSPDGRSSL
ncbi:hypothetical protein A2707_02065 [Candidatus Saccharibacteria bacterium RIFCSPHIGHO2_01_FULL_45_15]|jgi:hypothetical protein|nr:MAG: hypothetical protein A2707_02065 [Candidatus Saccharibacteria bacterium RIFCSPHIGHO2_01_FULL_45_15]OGL27582.1 MAG: hypothetical protein A3C39_00445 [Candidatus Saccharibacteria bacterium RIFCSPHIGHO2_02_FULL_46_12]OGL31634.1 MAG: hypothetical protein A3E76_00775 [Candidatus Saccharibacteria bacterium RIFCSPHIGHO2_12_FULL_44_22]